MLKKFVVSLLFLTSFLFAINSAHAEEIRWDGAVIAKGQVGKMTFSKDVKVYKKEADGSFTSLVVKKGNFFRVYYVEKSSVGIVYGMSNGYRVQSTNLVIYRAVPQEVQSMFGLTVKEKDVLITNQNIKRKIYEVSGAISSKVLHTMNTALQQTILEETEIELSYQNPLNKIQTFYEYSILTNENNRLAILLQKSKCAYPCNDISYEVQVKMFNVATGQEMKLNDVVLNYKQRLLLKEKLVAADPTGLSKNLVIESIPFYETNDKFHFLINNHGKLVDIELPKEQFAKRLIS